MVTIKVGQTLEEFVIHKKLLCDKSPYFNAMFNGNFAEATSQAAEEKEVDLAAFELFYHWLYMGTLVENITEVVGLDVDKDKVRIAFYALADKFILDTDFKTEYIKYMTSVYVSRHPQVPFSVDAVKLSIDHLTASDPMRILVLDIVCRDCMVNSDRNVLKGYLDAMDADNARFLTIMIVEGFDDNARNAAKKRRESWISQGSKGRYSTAQLKRQHEGQESEDQTAKKTRT